MEQVAKVKQAFETLCTSVETLANGKSIIKNRKPVTAAKNKFQTALQALVSKNKKKAPAKKQSAQEWLRENNFTYVNEALDGNCFFHTVARFVYGRPDWHWIVRQEICDYNDALRKRDELHAFNEEDKNMRNNAVYADHVEVAAAQNLYHIRIEVYQQQGKNPAPTLRIGVTIPEALPTLYVYRIDNRRVQHYDSLRKNTPEGLRDRLTALRAGNMRAEFRRAVSDAIGPIRLPPALKALTQKAVKAFVAKLEKDALSVQKKSSRKLRPYHEKFVKQFNDILREQSGNNYVVVTLKSGVTKNDFRTLASGVFVNDQIINSFGELVSEHVNEKSVPSILILTTYFAAYDGPDKIQRQKRAFNSFHRQYRDYSIFSIEKIFVPVNINNAHWILLECRMQDQMILCWDSYKPKEKEHKENYFGLLLDVFEIMWKEYLFSAPFPRKQWKFSLAPALSQTGVTCGVFTCIHILYRALDKPIDFTVPEINEYFRPFVAACILAKTLLPFEAKPAAASTPPPAGKKAATKKPAAAVEEARKEVEVAQEEASAGKKAATKKPAAAAAQVEEARKEVEEAQEEARATEAASAAAQVESAAAAATAAAAAATAAAAQVESAAAAAAAATQVKSVAAAAAAAKQEAALEKTAPKTTKSLKTAKSATPKVVARPLAAAQAKQQAYVFDFDMTLTNKHSGGTPDVNDNTLMTQETIGLVKSLFDDLVRQNIRVFVVTRGVAVDVRKYLAQRNVRVRVLGSANETQINEPFQGLPKEKKMALNSMKKHKLRAANEPELLWAHRKYEILNFILNHVQTDTDQVFFFDDTHLNIETAKIFGFKHSFHVTPGAVAQTVQFARQINDEHNVTVLSSGSDNSSSSSGSDGDSDSDSDSNSNSNSDSDSDRNSDSDSNSDSNSDSDSDSDSNSNDGNSLVELTLI